MNDWSSFLRFFLKWFEACWNMKWCWDPNIIYLDHKKTQENIFQEKHNDTFEA